MNYGDLKAQVLAYAHRPDLTSEVAGFVELAEGLIRRDVQAMPLTVTLDDDDRVTGGIYTLPNTVDVVRAIHALDNAGRSRPLDQVGMAELRQLHESASVQRWAANGDTIEVRGVPATGAELELHYLGHPPPLADDADENKLLTNHPALYLYGSLFHLYQFTQDLELAQGALDTFNDALTKLNEAAGRKLGGARVAGAYHFGPIYRGY